MSKSNFWEWRPDLINTGTIPTSGPTPNGITAIDTSAAGTPTYEYANGTTEGGEIEVEFSNTNEIQIVSLVTGSMAPFHINYLTEARFRFKMAQAALDAATQFAIGLVDQQDDTIDSIQEQILLRIIGADSPTTVVVESDDGVHDNNDIATGKVIADIDPHEFLISFARGKSDVRLFLDGQPVALTTTFDLSNYGSAFQFFAQLQKTADTNVDGFKLLPGTRIRGRAVHAY